MSDLPSSFAPEDMQVTSSDLVRQFGVWQDRAMKAPVYILNRGRPRLVLTSVELMDALASEHEEQAPDQGFIEAVIETQPEAILQFDQAGRLIGFNRAARGRFGVPLQPGASAARITRASGEFLQHALERVLASGTSETIEFISDRHPERRLTASLDPLPSGALVTVRDATAVEDLREKDLALRSLTAAVNATGQAAVVRINARGYLIDPGEALSSMTGAPLEQLGSARFLTLIAVAQRPAVGDLIEAAFSRGVAATMTAELLVRGATGHEVKISLSPVKGGGTIAEVLAVLVKRGGE